MTTTKASQTAEGAPRFLTPEEIGRLVKTFRTAHGWTQETLADLSGLQGRTIQRVEQGQPSSLDTRRALARAFAFDDIDFFNTPKGFPSDEELRKKQEAFDREHVVLDVQRVTGRQLLTLMKDTPHCNAIAAMSLAELPRPAQDIFAVIVDYVHDCMDILDEATHTQMLSFGDELDENIAELNRAGFCLCAAFRNTKLTSDTGTGKTLLPWSCRIIYLLAGPKDRLPAKVAVSRNPSGGP